MMRAPKPATIALIGSFALTEGIALLLSMLLPVWLCWIMIPIGIGITVPALRIAEHVENWQARRREREWWS